MAWEVTFNNQKGKVDIGQATAHFKDGAGDVVFSRSKAINGKMDANKFVAWAKAQKVLWDADQTDNDKIATALTNKLNAG